MTVLHLPIDSARMVRRINELAQCSATAVGVTRLSFSPESEKANSLVARWMEEAGMDVRKDQMNNIIGRYEGKNCDAPALLVGSHLDSVVEAGKYDGVLGVVAAIEVVHTLHSNGIRPSYPIEVIGFSDEEGARFHTTLLGSRAMAGHLRSEELFVKDDHGTTLAEAMERIGMNPYRYREAVRDPRTILGYIELHIEQGPILEQIGQACGAVSGIAGQSRYTFRIDGKSGHAGTVPVKWRKDALAGAAEVILTVEQMARQYDQLMITVGKLSVFPGVSNVIPGTVEGTIDIRSINDELRKTALDELIRKCENIAERRGLACRLTKVMDSPAVLCSRRLTNVITAVLQGHGMNPVELVSGAGHDAMALASITDVGMIFVRCKNGVSHHPDEFVSIEDIRKGTSVLLDVIWKLTS
ncbi:allantoate amidohydrolase [Parageobacillus thermoglucosidasius]|uniref:allantoate amidohydrolase n=1 Tax=Parageobacillus thermoglucosidasius TaxID=1426 RepID=UPI000B54D87A|nr:allantoate amidohydrolase [Parageobacillus thermoglucosidasius]MBY6270035.1 allantoate amidohydrolase [Parageobacillus thermoglucosidasius]OUM93767.1 MAG: Zn-dependent hydrolase [Parageobacillus thermoglucosidasius]